MSLIDNLIKKGELPTVNVDVSVSKKTLIDTGVAAVIVCLVILLLNKLVFSKL